MTGLQASVYRYSWALTWVPFALIGSNPGAYGVAGHRPGCIWHGWARTWVVICRLPRYSCHAYFSMFHCIITLYRDYYLYSIHSIHRAYLIVTSTLSILPMEHTWLLIPQVPWQTRLHWLGEQHEGNKALGSSFGDLVFWDFKHSNSQLY